MAPVLRQIYDQMAEPKYVLAMGVCASSGGMFNNYAIVQGVDHVVPVDMYLPGCPPRPEMLFDAVLKLHDQVQHQKLGANRERRDRMSSSRKPWRHPDLSAEGSAAVMHELVPQSAPRELEVIDVREGAFGVQRHRRHQRLRRPHASGRHARASTPPFGGWFDEVYDES